MQDSWLRERADTADEKKDIQVDWFCSAGSAGCGRNAYVL